ncbi:MAG: hypothetical protein RL670_323, partial [Actinomycetota bacterium]
GGIMAEDFDLGPVESRVNDEATPWSIAELGNTLKDWIEKLGWLWVEGELAQLQVRGGAQMFGELRDLNSETSVQVHSWSMVGVEAGLQQGDRVVALIRPKFWGKGGRLQHQVAQMRKVGLGELLERIEKLKQQLIAEGLTAAERKQPIPFLPGKIGLITGKDSDAEKDVLQNSLRRWPEAQFRVIHTKVSGNSAAEEVIAALKELDSDPSIDVIIVARGGGAFTDLVVFSDEKLVRAAAATSKPLVSAIGHENDSPLLDLVADLRASTPTDAAKRVVPDVVQERAGMATALNNIRSRISQLIDGQVQLIANARSRPMLANPYAFVETHQEQLNQVTSRLRTRFGQQLELAEQSVDHLRQQVRALSPQSTLDRGYAVVQTNDGQVVRSAKAVKAGAKLQIRVAEGTIAATAETSTVE